VGIKLPLTVPQMLWVNLIMDTFAALALATEPPVETVMEKPPRDPAEFIITRPMAVFILGVGAVFLAGLISGLFYLRTPNGQAHPSGYGLSVFFTAFVLAQFWNLFNTRVFGRGASAFNGLFQNKAFLLVSAAILLGQVLIVQFGGRVFRTVPLSFTHWLEILALTSPVLWCGEGLRFVDRLRKKR
jgi:Ca2+-transporting ATPase